MRTLSLAALLLASLGAARAEGPSVVGTAPPPGSVVAPAAASRTLLLGVHVGRDGRASVAFASLKPQAFVPPARQHRASWVLKVLTEGGEVLGEVPVPAPRLCHCPSEAPHRQGDVLLEHEATVLVRAPSLTGREVLVLESRKGQESVRVSLEEVLRGTR